MGLIGKGSKNCLYEFGYAWYMMKDTKTLPEDQAEHVETAAPQIKKTALLALKDVKQKFGSFTILSWIVESIINSVTERDNYVVFTTGWKLRDRDIGLQVLPWLCCGEFVLNSINGECMKDEDFFPRGDTQDLQNKIQGICSQVMPRYVLRIP